MPVQTVTLDFYADPVPLYCPACGQPFFSAGEFKSGCQHIIFAAQTLPKKWVWHDERTEKIFIEALQHAHKTSPIQNYPCFDDYLANLHIDSVIRTACDSYSRNSAFMLNVTTSDRGCGGMCQGTVYALIDFNPEAV